MSEWQTDDDVTVTIHPSPWDEQEVGRLLARTVADTHDCAMAAVQDYWDDPARLVPLAQTIRECEETLRMARRDLEAAIGQLPVGTVVGRAEVARQTGYVQVRWDELLPRVVALLADTPGVVWSEDGERLPGHVVAENLARELHRCVGFSAPKKPGLAALGLDLDEWATRKPTTTIRWAKHD